jgi:radical SAM protein (TIGR01212 family)
LPSTSFPHPKRGTPDWRSAGLRYHSLNWFFRRKFGHRVGKISVDGGFRCPNVESPAGTGGCIFCNIPSFSPSRRGPPRPITAQIDDAARRLRGRCRAEHFVAYFQPATNTYAPVERLRAAYEEALAHPQVVGLAIGTRPDCVPEEVLDLLAELSQRTWLVIEYGLQSVHDRSLAWLRRGHDYAAFLDAIERSHRRGLAIGAHVILGLPGERREDMLATAREVARLPIHSVKLHNLYAVKDTPLADAVAAGSVRLPELDEYIGYVVDFLEAIPGECVVDRLCGDAPPQYLIAPKWCTDKSSVRMAIEAEFMRRDSWQGKGAVSNQQSAVRSQHRTAGLPPHPPNAES